MLPLIKLLDANEGTSFEWIDGGHLAKPPPNLKEYFDQPPLYRFFDIEGLGGVNGLLASIKSLPKARLRIVFSQSVLPTVQIQVRRP